LEPWVIKFPKLLDWQMADYVKAYSPLLPDSEVEELINLCNRDIYRLNNELHKLTLFPASEHRVILAEIKAEEGTNLCQLSSFALA
jgi:hypothetical protein